MSVIKMIIFLYCLRISIDFHFTTTRERPRNLQSSFNFMHSFGNSLGTYGV